MLHRCNRKNPGDIRIHTRITARELKYEPVAPRSSSLTPRGRRPSTRRTVHTAPQLLLVQLLESSHRPAPLVSHPPLYLSNKTSSRVGLEPSSSGVTGRLGASVVSGSPARAALRPSTEAAASHRTASLLLREASTRRAAERCLLLTYLLTYLLTHRLAPPREASTRRSRGCTGRP